MAGISSKRGIDSVPGAEVGAKKPSDSFIEYRDVASVRALRWGIRDSSYVSSTDSR